MQQLISSFSKAESEFYLNPKANPPNWTHKYY